MSRVGKRIIKLSQDTTLTIDENNVVIVKGIKGQLVKKFSNLIKISVSNFEVKTTRLNNIRTTKMLHGTTNSLIQGMVEGVEKGFSKELEIIGVGYNVKQQGKNLEFSLGLSHKVLLEVPEHLKADIVSPTELKISGIDKQQVGEFAAKIKSFRKPEPYGGKGIRYKGEYIIRKAGKAAK